MNTDDLRQPLKRRKLRERFAFLRPSALQSATALSLIAAAGLTVWAVRNGDPMAGEPVVTVAVERTDPIITSSVTPGSEEQDEPFIDSQETLEPDQAEVEQHEAAIVQPSRKRLAAAPIKAVSQKTSLGTLPKIAKNGKKPWLVYARPISNNLMASDSPKVAIVLGGMGLNRQLTDQAIKDLPGEITLAFAPYGKKLQRQVNKARQYGHEVMLQLPMEPFGYPAVDPGPKTLLIKDKADVTMKNLKWHMSRFSGYIGVVNYLGARFTSDGDGIGYVLRDINKRGLVYLDDGSSKRSVVPSLGQVMNAPVLVNDMIIDSEVTYNAITAALARLEQQAASDGFAIGFGSGLSLTMDALTSWSRDLRSRNIILVPVSAAYRPRQS
ncbi:MAG: divergent polysaccharide deacetylase family protein [Hyphomicrobiales bacterium]|nr:divergent polysaccharide deacetylase family protein [Hyphomicrobiales bacterium]